MACENLKKLLGGDAVCFSSSISAIENGKKIIFNNPGHKTVCKVHVDNCLVVNQTVKKCDFLFDIQEGKRYYLVELKGKAIDIAIQQIVSTFDLVNIKIKTAPQNYTGIIVSSAVPKAANQKFKNLQDKVYRDKKLLIKRKQNHFEELI